jgi:hypothetical protein
MKKLTFLFVAFLVVIATTLTAQKPFSGTIKFKSQITGTEDPNVLANTPPEMEVIVFGNMSKIVFAQEGATISLITDGDKRFINIVYEIPTMGTYYMQTPEKDIKSKYEFIEFKYQYLDEVKMIAGYSCKKVIATITNLETDEEEIVTFYVSNEISSNDFLNFTQYPGLIGYPLRIDQSMEETAPGATLVMEATEVVLSETLSVSSFDLPAKAIDINADPELKKMFGMSDPE